VLEQVRFEKPILKPSKIGSRVHALNLLNQERDNPTKKTRPALFGSK
jgi:hypothetical protein